MGNRFQITVDCADPDRLCDFWSAALGYRIQGPPGEYATWTAYWLDQGIPAEELGNGIENDRLTDPDGVGPSFWFQQVPETKTIKNRLHLDILPGGGRSVPLAERKERVDAEAARLESLGATRTRMLSTEGVDHYAIVMQDPEGNEFCLA